MPQMPLSSKQKRLANLFTLVFSLGFCLSVALVDSFGTYTAYAIPTLIESIGFVFIITLWLLVAFTAIYFPHSEGFTIDNPLANVPLTAIYLGLAFMFLMIDLTLFGAAALTSLTAFATENQALISLIFSALLVLLYYDQHRTQRRQAQLMTRQTELAERQASWREEEERPRLRVSEWCFHNPDTPLKVNSHVEEFAASSASLLASPFAGNSAGFFDATITNEGATTAQSVSLRIEVMVQSSDLPNGYLHLNGSFLIAFSNLARRQEDIQDNLLNRESILIGAGETIGLIGSLFILPMGIEHPPKSLGKLIQRLPFSVGKVVFRASIVYNSPIGEKHSTPVCAVRLPAKKVETLGDAFKPQLQVGFHAVPTFGLEESVALLGERYGEVRGSGDVWRMEYQWNEAQQTVGND